MATTRSQAEQENQAWFEMLSNPATEKQAVDAINDFTRVKIREDSFWERIMPTLPITNDELDRQLGTDKPVKIVDKEPGSPAALSIPFATLTRNFYIRGPKYAVMFARLVTPKAVKDVDELRTYYMDIRQIVSDNMIKDLLAEYDSKAISAVETALIGVNTNVPWSGVPQWVELHGGITRENMMESFKVMPRTDAHLQAAKCLVNNVTIYDFLKWDRLEAGGDLSQDWLKNGWSQTRFAERDWLTTVKRDLVPDSRQYMFADPQFVGKSFELEGTTMFIKREAYMLEFFSYTTRGGSLGHTGGLAIVDYV